MRKVFPEPLYSLSILQWNGGLGRKGLMGLEWGRCLHSLSILLRIDLQSCNGPVAEVQREDWLWSSHFVFLMFKCARSSELLSLIKLLYVEGRISLKNTLAALWKRMFYTEQAIVLCLCCFLGGKIFDLNSKTLKLRKENFIKRNMEDLHGDKWMRCFSLQKWRNFEQSENIYETRQRPHASLNTISVLRGRIITQAGDRMGSAEGQRTVICAGTVVVNDAFITMQLPPCGP